MKKALFTLLFSIVFLSLSAQDFEIVSVESLPADMSAREEMKTDHNDRQCALLRIATQNIIPEQRERFTFKPDLGSEIVDRANRNGEILLWVSPGLKYLLIMHRDWGQYELRLPDYVTRIEALHTYKVTIKGTLSLATQEQSNTSPSQQYLVFQLSPTNAVLEVDGQLWEVGPDGTAMKFVNFGTYSYRVQAPNHIAVSGKVIVDDPNNAKTEIVKLESDLVEVTFQVDADAEIWINNIMKGIRTWTGELGKSTYKIECKQEGCETSTISKEITGDMNGQTVNLPVPKPIFGSLNIESTPIGATIYIDGNEVGKTPKFIPEIIVGEHEIKLTKENYAIFSEAIILAKGEKKQVKATLVNAKYYEEGKSLFDQGNFQEAFGLFSKGASIGDAKSKVMLGRMYYHGKGVESDCEQAMYWFQSAIDQNYGDAFAWMSDIYTEGICADTNYNRSLELLRKSVELGSGYGMNNLGQMYHYGLGVEQDNVEALKWFRNSAELGDPMGMAELGYMYENGYGVTQNYSEAVKWYRLAANQGSDWAQYRLGLAYEKGRGVNNDYSEAMKWYRKAAENNYRIAQTQIGRMYTFGYGVGKDYVEAIKWYQKAADQEYDQAQLMLGYMYLNGYGVEKDYSEAAKWIKKAAEQGLARAQNELGNLYYHGYGVLQNYTEAIRWYREAADKNYVVALRNMGFMYYNGYGVAKDYNEALRWFKIAANEGYAEAQTYIGKMYENGYGVDVDYSEAMKWYRKAADQDYAEAQYRIGTLYFEGKGVVKDEKEVLKWISMSAKNGYAKAQYGYGILYESGYGIEKDIQEAKKWYKKAADQGDKNAIKRLNGIK